MAKYKMAQESYIDDVPYLAGAIFDDKDGRHVPAPHWEPMDDDAKAICAKHSIKFTGEIPDSIEDMTRKLATDMANKRAADAVAGQPAAIGVAVVDALVEAGVVERKVKKAPARTDI